MTEVAVTSRLDIETVLRSALGVTTRNALPLAVLALVLVGLPSLLLRGDILDATVIKRGLWTSFGLSGAVLVLAQALLQAATVRLVWRDLDGQPPLGLRDAIGQSADSMMTIVLLALTIAFAKAIWFLLMIPGFLALLLPGLLLLGVGVYVLVSWSVAIPAAVIEQRGALSALGRSAALTRGNRWSLFGLIVLLVIAGILLSAVGQALGGATAALIVEAAMVAFGSIALVVVYRQLAG